MEYQACTQICLQMGVFVALACIVCAWHLWANHMCQNLFFNQSSEPFNQKSLKTQSQVLSLYCNGGSQGDTGTTAQCHICSEGHGVENTNYNFWKTKSSKSLLNQRLAVLHRYSAWTCLKYPDDILVPWRCCWRLLHQIAGSFAHQRLRAWGCVAGRRSSSFILGVFCHLATEAHERWEWWGIALVNTCDILIILWHFHITWRSEGQNNAKHSSILNTVMWNGVVLLKVDCWTRFIQDLAKVPSERPDVVMNTCSEELDSTCIT